MAIEAISLLWFLIIGLVAGWLADILVKGVGFGLIGDLIVGVIGAFIGGFVFSILGVGAGGSFGTFIAAFVGAVILLLLIRLINRK